MLDCIHWGQGQLSLQNIQLKNQVQYWHGPQWIFLPESASSEDSHSVCAASMCNHMHQHVCAHIWDSSVGRASNWKKQAQYWHGHKSIVPQWIFHPESASSEDSYSVCAAPVCNHMHQHVICVHPSGTAQLVEHPKQNKKWHNTDMGTRPWCCSGFFTQSASHEDL